MLKTTDADGYGEDRNVKSRQGEAKACAAEEVAEITEGSQPEESSYPPHPRPSPLPAKYK